MRIDRRALPIILLASLVCAGVASGQSGGTDRDQVLALERDVALVLAQQGFDAYAALFHPDYTNWSGGDTVLNRQAYLDRVKPWFEAGNRAVSTDMRPVTIEILGDYALSRYTLREDFTDGTAFVGRFVSVARRYHGRWTLYRTSFMTIFRGPRGEAPLLGR